MIHLFNPNAPVVEEDGTPNLLLMAPVDPPMKLGHIAWHFMMSFFMALDGILGVCTLGIRFPGFSAWWERGAGSFLWNHEAAHRIEQREQMEQTTMHVTGLTRDQIKDKSEDELKELCINAVQNDVNQILRELSAFRGEPANDNGPETLN